MKNKYIILTLLALLASPALAGAEEGKQGPRKEINEMRGEMRKEVSEKKDELKTDRQEKRQEIKDMRAASSTKEEIRARIKTLEEEWKEKKSLTKEEIQKKREEFKAKAKEFLANFKEGKKQKLDAAKTEKVKTQISKAFERLSGVIKNLEAFDAKVAGAIEKKKAKGLDTTESENNLSAARDLLSDAKADVEAVQTALNEAVGSAEGTSKEAIRAAVTKAIESIKNTREAYRKVITSLPKGDDDTQN